MTDPFDSGTPKYSTAQDIYDALCELVQTEEMNILSEIGVDVSWENQTYYYTDKGNTLKDKFEQLSDHGVKMWLMDLAIHQMNDNSQIHDLVYTALINPELAKRIGFKKIFVDKLLEGNGKNYDVIIENFADEIGEFNRFDNYNMALAFKKIAEENGIYLCDVMLYQKFAWCLNDRVQGLKLMDEIKLILECRAHLTAYDDFIYGMRANQALHEMQEQQYKQKVIALQAAHDEKIKYLFIAAERAGLLPALNAELQRLEISVKAVAALDAAALIGEDGNG